MPTAQIPSAAEYIAALDRYVGYTENPANSNCNRFSKLLGRPCQKWCADCLVAVAVETGLILPSTAAFTPTLAGGFKTVGRWFPKTDPGQIGDFSFWSFGGERIDHVEAVKKPGTKLLDIGGNTASDNSGDQTNGGGVFERLRTRGKLVGFGRPAWRITDNPTHAFPTEEDDDMPRIVALKNQAVFAVGYTTEEFTDTDGTVRRGAWRQTFKNPDHLEQHVGGGGFITKPDGSAFDVTIPGDVFETVYGDRGAVQP